MTVWLLLAVLGSAVAAVTDAVLVITAPFGVVGDTKTVKVKIAEPPEASVPIVPAIVPVPPAAGPVRLNAGPEVWASETKVVLAGTTSENATVWASLGPAFETVTV